MVWWLTARNHAASISGWVRGYLRASGVDKFLFLLPVAAVWSFGWLLLALIAGEGNFMGFAMISLFVAWVVDAIVDKRFTTGEISRLMTRDDVVLATRAEYIGGHPRLPHGRFVYLTISGTRENPILTILFPGNKLVAEETFEIPLLDLDKMDEKSETAESLTGSILASISEKPGKMLSGERVTLSVRYQGPGGRKHLVELSSFYHGNDEVRNWRNYLVCTQAQADTGIEPRQPWKSLQPEPQLAHTAPLEEVAHGSGNGPGDESPDRRNRSAFDRR